MGDSITAWLVLAVIIFWSVGAYNRMMRLRTHAIAAFAPVANLLQQYLSLIRTISPELVTEPPVDAAAAGNQYVVAGSSTLTSVAGEFSQALKAANSVPLEAAAVDTLRGKLESLCLSWLQLQNLPADLAWPVLPETLQLQWNRVAFEFEKARVDFNEAVGHYNNAIAQFPAVVLARLTGFQPARLL